MYCVCVCVYVCLCVVCVCVVCPGFSLGLFNVVLRHVSVKTLQWLLMNIAYTAIAEEKTSTTVSLVSSAQNKYSVHQ